MLRLMYHGKERILEPHDHASVVTPNPANGGHLKTGQWESNQDKP
jgi:hypothetical protein